MMEPFKNIEADGSVKFVSGICELSRGPMHNDQKHCESDIVQLPLIGGARGNTSITMRHACPTASGSAVRTHPVPLLPGTLHVVDAVLAIHCGIFPPSVQAGSSKTMEFFSPAIVHAVFSTQDREILHVFYEQLRRRDETFFFFFFA